MSKAPFSPTENQHEQDVQNLTDFVLFSQRSCILRLSPELTKGKISFPQFFLLAYLDEEECLSMSNIARMMGHSTAAATGMIDKLQELGHLKRYTAAADRRKIMVRITEQGRALVAQMRSNIATDSGFSSKNFSIKILVSDFSPNSTSSKDALLPCSAKISE